jgi:hypothetical protein
MKRHVFLMMMAVAAIVLAGYKPKADEQSSAPGTITLTIAPYLEGAYGIQLGIVAQQLIIDWGDGSAAETYSKATIHEDKVTYYHQVSHIYAGDGTYTVQIKGEGLTGFTCDYSNTTSLDVSGCPTLAQLRCGVNRLTSLDVSKCPALEYLDCESNQLSAAALNTIFTALPNRTVADDAHINISDNPGAESCNRAIAGSKGWGIYYWN